MRYPVRNYKDQYTVKKVNDFPAPAKMSITKLSLAGVVKLFLARESLVNDIPAGDGKIYNLFLQCRQAIAIPPPP